MINNHIFQKTFFSLALTVLGSYFGYTYAMTPNDTQTSGTEKSDHIVRTSFNPTSLLQEPITITHEQLNKILPHRIRFQDIDAFKQKIKNAYQELAQGLAGTSYDELSQKAQEYEKEKKYEQALHCYVQAYVGADQEDQQRILTKLVSIVSCNLDEELLYQSLYALAGSAKPQAQIPLYIMLKRIGISKQAQQIFFKEPILLLANLIRDGDGSALDQLRKYYLDLELYEFAYLCCQLALDMHLKHSDCAFGELYQHLVVGYPEKKPARLTPYAHPEEAFACYISHAFKHFKQCWESHNCSNARNHVVHLLSSSRAVSYCTSDDLRINLLEQALQEGSIQAAAPLKCFYEYTGNYRKALGYCDASKHGFYTKARLHEKLSEFELAEKAYQQAAEMEEQEVMSSGQCDTPRNYTLWYGEFLARKNKYTQAREVLCKALDRCDSTYWREVHILLGNIMQHIQQPELAQNYYLQAALKPLEEYCPPQLIFLYQQQPYHPLRQKIINAYKKDRKNYCVGLLIEYVREHLGSNIEKANEFYYYNQSLKKAETLKALKKLIEKNLYSQQELIDKIQQCEGTQAFKDEALKLLQ